VPASDDDPVTDTTTVRRVGPDDVASVREVRLRALADAPDAYWVTEEQARAEPIGAWLDRLARPRGATFLAERGGAAIGMAVGNTHHDVDGDAGLYAMWVAPEIRRAGVARMLIEAVLEWARADGFPRIRLEVADSNAAAITAYRALGFTPTGRSGTMPPPRDHIAEHELALDLHPPGRADQSPDAVGGHSRATSPS
jgi:ribosomal protein S18 acetylase RimI-like enzyme